jgi:hypothetical protein
MRKIYNPKCHGAEPFNATNADGMPMVRAQITRA